MIKCVLNNEILGRLLAIERAKERFAGVRFPPSVAGKLRKSSKKMSSYASNKIEGNPLNEAQADAAVESSRRHYLKPEQEIRNYFDALVFLEKAVAAGRAFSKRLLLETQRIVVRGESAEKRGFRGPMPPGVLFAVYDDATRQAEYSPPEAKDVEGLVDELVAYVAESGDHPVLKAAVVHYQIATIHPFEDGNGRTARLMSDFVLDANGYGFGGIGSLEEYFAFDVDEYYRSLQMGLPVLYYDGRNEPPRPEIWFSYFTRMMELHAAGALRIADASDAERRAVALSHLGKRERAFLAHLEAEDIRRFAPADLAKPLGVTNRTIINWCAGLVHAGFLLPETGGKRIRFYVRTSP